METVKTFLESSTIHGLAYIATGRKYVRLFWILVVIAGFTGAGFLIHTSFQSWSESPVKTTIETHPIKQITFPKIIVCPPKKTYTAINYDLMTVKEMAIDNDTRHDLTKYAYELLQDKVHEQIMSNMEKLVDHEKYYNWYNGYTKITLPKTQNGIIIERIDTFAPSGSISTQYFGQQFSADKLEQNLDYEYSIWIQIPSSAWANENVTLHFEIETFSTIGSDYDQYWVQYVPLTPENGRILNNFTSPSQSRFMRNIRY